MSRSVSASVWANMLPYLVLELEVRVDEYSVLSPTAASDRIRISFCFRNRSPASFLPSE